MEGFIRWKANRFFYAYQDRCKQLTIDFDDLCQVGYLALVKSVAKYDPSRGAKFSVLFSLYLKQEFFRLTKMHYSGWENNMIYSCKSLNAPIDNIEGPCLLDILIDTGNELEAVENQMNQEVIEQVILTAFKSLTSRQIEIISALYFDGQTFETVAKRYGISKGAVQSARRAGFRKLRSNPELCAVHAH